MAGRRLAALGATLAAASAQNTTWNILDANIGTISTGIAFVNATHGYVPVSVNGVGTEILHTKNGGKTWQKAKDEPFALLLLDIAAYGSTVNVIGALTIEYSLNYGVDYNTSLAPLGAGQCIRTIGGANPVGYAAVGQFGLFTESNGVAVSTDFGITYSNDNITDLGTFTRYGAFPDPKIWFVAAGDWPGEGSDDDPSDDNPPAKEWLARRKEGPFAIPGMPAYPEHYKNDIPAGSKIAKVVSGGHLHIVQTPEGKLVAGRVKREAFLHAVTNQAGVGSGNATSWDAQIAVTTDAGSTWTIPFSRLNSNFYLNGIECSSTSQCCAVGESGDGQTGGTYIWCSSDQGNTWNEAFIDNDPDSSLTDIAYLSPNEFWAVGGEDGLFGFTGPHFYHTVDGGKTWDLFNGTNMANQYAIAVDCIPGAGCWANLLDILTQESSIAFVSA